ncbi:MAG: hypothetical protein Hyperionvirus20_38 [Hyperionvirus sp.]|uniref:Uncharacterized protein n=1 Tax=Hyperionvirus sp. TaxID=2487770 RepID=A0A3G5AAI8_9VIRU|nr:MAG: hypothetical protein Hyperionvirus20_38 [Hyperionvirus sp.]
MRMGTKSFPRGPRWMISPGLTVFPFRIPLITTPMPIGLKTCSM